MHVVLTVVSGKVCPTTACAVHAYDAIIIIIITYLLCMALYYIYYNFVLYVCIKCKQAILRSDQ